MIGLSLFLSLGLGYALVGDDSGEQSASEEERQDEDFLSLTDEDGGDFLDYVDFGHEETDVSEGHKPEEHAFESALFDNHVVELWEDFASPEYDFLNIGEDKQVAVSPDAQDDLYILGEAETWDIEALEDDEEEDDYFGTEDSFDAPIVDHAYLPDPHVSEKLDEAGETEVEFLMHQDKTPILGEPPISNQVETPQFKNNAMWVGETDELLILMEPEEYGRG